jgi:aldose 1-epimerase
MIELHAGAASLTILPEAGGAVARLACAGRDLLVPIPPGADPNRGFHGAFIMAPWTNRLSGGRMTVAGAVHHLPITNPVEDTAIHGYLRDLPWSVLDVHADRLTLECRFDRTPFRGMARLAVRLFPERLTLSLALTNEAPAPTPMGIGWHPYVPRPPGTRLRAAARTVFGRDHRNLPTTPRPSAGLNGGDAVLDGLDTHFAGWDGRAEIGWPDGRRLTLQAAGAWAANLQVFAPRKRGVMAVEPVSHAPDAANNPAAARHGPMDLIKPQQTLTGTLTINWE